MTEAEELERLTRIVRVIQQRRYSLLHAFDKGTGRALTILCEEQDWGTQLAQVVPLAQLDPLPTRPLLLPQRGSDDGKRNELN